MELSLPHTLHLFNVFRENKDSDNCAQVLEEECIRMFGTKYLNDEHDCNVVSMNSLNIQNANDDFTSHDKNVSYKHVNFCGVKKFDYIHRVTKRFHLRSTRVRRHTLPLSLLCISMDRSCVCIEFFLFFIQRSPTVPPTPRTKTP